MNVFLFLLILALLVVFSVDVKQKRRKLSNDQSLHNGR
jgi:hypothetical protein